MDYYGYNEDGYFIATCENSNLRLEVVADTVTRELKSKKKTFLFIPLKNDVELVLARSWKIGGALDDDYTMGVLRHYRRYHGTIEVRLTMILNATEFGSEAIIITSSSGNDTALLDRQADFLDEVYQILMPFGYHVKKNDEHSEEEQF